MYKKVFLDANVIADIYDESRSFHKQSDKAIITLVDNPNVKLFTSCDLIISNDKRFVSENIKLMSSEAFVL